MKLITNITLENQYLPKDYRRGFISLIKKAFSETDNLLFQRLYQNSHPINKPFTFSAYFPDLKGEEKGLLNVGNKCVFNFSTNDSILMTHLYNGIRKINKHKWKDYNTFSIENFKVFFNKDIKNDSCIFKSISPFLINKEGDNLEYITPENEDFDKCFRHSVYEQARSFLNKNNIELEYKIQQYKKMVVSHYNQSMTCNKVIIEIKSDPEVLNLLYNIGIGVRRSQGFGMVEVI